MSKLIGWFRQPGNRGYVYRVLAAAGVLAAGYGLISGDELGLWLGFGATVLGTGSAVVNTPTTAQLRTNPDAYVRQLDDQAADVEAGRVKRKFER